MEKYLAGLHLIEGTCLWSESRQLCHYICNDCISDICIAFLEVINIFLQNTGSLSSNGKYVPNRRDGGGGGCLQFPRSKSDPLLDCITRSMSGVVQTSG